VIITYHGRKIRLDEDMLRLLQWALERPGRWVKIAEDGEAVKRTAQGLVEVFEVAQMYRVHDKALAKSAPPKRVARGSRRPGSGRER
jgi:hypothetical protein